jgi:hypothetical protein
MLSAIACLLAIAYLPGAIIFRLPIADRDKRAALPAEERVFWSVVLSVIWSSAAVLGLAAIGEYTFERLLFINGAECSALLIALRSGLRLGASAPRTTWSALVPVALAVAGFFINFHVPPSEYIVGGRDPGVYMNEGMLIAQRGGLTTTDEVAASVPAAYRDLFFVETPDPHYHSVRFMGFFLLDADSGAVVGQFPQLFPAWLAIGYGINGITGARWVPGLAAILGLVAVYFAGVRLIGRPAAVAGAGLLAVHVVQIWYAKYPNAEIVMQPLMFGAVLAYVRAQFDGDRFFAPVAAILLVLGMFAHITAAVAIAALVGASVVDVLEGRRPQLLFAVTLAVGTAVVVLYLMTVLRPYFQQPLGFVKHLQIVHLALIGAIAATAAAMIRAARSATIARRIRQGVPMVLVGMVWAAAIYAYFFRTAGGLLAPHDADALRTFTAFYITPIGLAAALIGFAILARRPPALPFLLLAALFSFFFFYKIRIVPEHFWASRRFLAVILPSALLMVGAAAFTGAPAMPRARYARYIAGVLLVALLGWHFTTASRPILAHVEYAGLIPRIEQLADAFGRDDLVLVESRGASDVHVLALPLAYIYDRKVLVLATTTPDKRMFREFLEWSRARHRRILFVGGGGTELLSRSTPAKSIGGERFQVPEYEAAWNAYPRGPRFKEFDFGIYEFSGEPASERDFTLDVGSADDLYVRQFHAKERHPDGSTFRWTRDVSYASILGVAPHQLTLTLWLDSGGRPAQAGPPRIEVFLNDQRLGAATVDRSAPYRFDIPAALAAAMAASEEAAQLRIVSSTWNPARTLGGSDSRDIGVMMERIEIR